MKKNLLVLNDCLPLKRMSLLSTEVRAASFFVVNGSFVRAMKQA